ncbi:hypothetical protein LNQ82_00795 [Conchiformibius steedae DSM 2580]|uniref:Uncharacterized protein n=1 Tax=Conchiformibius steedae DSM 2580 TaxID=1121352 RepID=A0AAE9KZD6_9NEIS|nr:hypothetical protein [Conchiformibius steedae]URD67733.1 hypothetical protein LNQ82_00795 [Conchiformibius steedae DSM 2580]
MAFAAGDNGGSIPRPCGFVNTAAAAVFARRICQMPAARVKFALLLFSSKIPFRFETLPFTAVK